MFRQLQIRLDKLENLFVPQLVQNTNKNYAKKYTYVKYELIDFICKNNSLYLYIKLSPLKHIGYNLANNYFIKVIYRILIIMYKKFFKYNNFFRY
jgi:hypothetical protein